MNFNIRGIKLERFWFVHMGYLIEWHNYLIMSVWGGESVTIQSQGF